MGRTLTIVARGPSHPYGPQQPEGDSAIQAICDMLDQRADGMVHIVAHASRVAEVKKHLKTMDPTSGDLVQLIGHGASGKLWLGGHWTKTETQNGRAVVLDSNPNYYGLLLDGVPPGCDVWLLGCTIGESSRIADGPTLLFDLARMWGCTVRATADYVTDDDFNNKGIFAHESRLVKAGQTGIQAAISFQPTGLASVPGVLPAQIALEKLIALPVIGIYGLPHQPHFNPPLARLNAFIGREVDGSRLLAAAELVVKIRLDNQLEIGELIGHYRVLRVRTSTQTRYFELDPLERETTLALVEALVKQVRR